MRPRIDLENALFILGSSLKNLQIVIESFGSPVLVVSKDIYNSLSEQQISAIQTSFFNRSIKLKQHFQQVNDRLSKVSSLGELTQLQQDIQHLADHYSLSEKVFDYYIDLLHTRSEKGMGNILNGCDEIALASLRQGLDKLNYNTPPVVCHLDAGQGAAILAAGIYLWDYQTNPAALIKVVRSAIPFPRLTSILHECGHQAAKITGWNEEIEVLIFRTLVSAGYSRKLAQMWRSWAYEIAADFWSLSQSNFASLIGLSEVLLSSSNMIFRVFELDPHPMGYLRVMLAIMACRTELGNGPWDDYREVWESLFPISMASLNSSKIIMESLPLLPLLSNAIVNTKMDCFSGKSLKDILPWEQSAPRAIKKFLNNDMSDFVISRDMLVKHPIIALNCFRYIQMFGGRPQKWIADGMHNWLISLSQKSKNGSAYDSDSGKEVALIDKGRM
jgi:hypothetical protein